MSTLRFITRWTLNLALVALFALSAVLVAAGTVLPNLDREMIIINGGSMAPAIPNGAAVIVDHHPQALAVGQVVTIRVPSSGGVFTHRIVEVIEDGTEPTLRTKGDANESPDATPSSASSVVGRVELAVPNLGYLAAAVQSGIGRAAVMSSLLVLLFLRWFWQDFFGSDDDAELEVAGRRPSATELSA